MSLFIEQANLCFLTTKTTEMIEISIVFIICLFLHIFEKKYRSKYWLFEANTDSYPKKGLYWPILMPILRHITNEDVHLYDDIGDASSSF